MKQLLEKIDKYHIERRLSDAERDRLYSMAREAPKANYDFALEIEKLWAAIRELKGGAVEETVKEYV